MTTDVQKPTLVYFHIGGRAEISRLLLEIAGVDYQYHSISFRNSPGEPWPEYKEKHAAELTFGQVPQYKEPGGLSIVQSASITRYLARKHGFNGSNEREAVAIDVLFEGASDLFTAIAKAAFADESKKAEEINNLLTNAAPNHLANLQRALEHNHGGQGFFVGDKISYADVGIFVALKNLDNVGGKSLIEKYNTLHGFQNRIANLAHVKRFYDSQPYKV